MSVTHFITCPAELTEAQFSEHYVSQLLLAIRETCEFVMGTSAPDTMARAWLIAAGVAPTSITVYMLSADRDAIDIQECNTMGFFPSAELRDAAMSSASHYCIAWACPETELNRNRHRQPVQRYTSSDAVTNVECGWAANYRNRCSWMHDAGMRDCVTMTERRGPGDVLAITICRSCMEANFSR